MRIIDQYEVTKDPNIPQKVSGVDLITATGEDYLRRATIEFQSQLMVNNMELLFVNDGLAIDILDLQLIDKVMDLHTSHMLHLTI